MAAAAAAATKAAGAEAELLLLPPPLMLRGRATSPAAWITGSRGTAPALGPIPADAGARAGPGVRVRVLAQAGGPVPGRPLASRSRMRAVAVPATRGCRLGKSHGHQARVSPARP